MKKYALFAFIFSFLGVVGVWGQTYTWTGLGTTNSWSDSANWDSDPPSEIPPGSFTASTNINASGVTLIINAQNHSPPALTVSAIDEIIVNSGNLHFIGNNVVLTKVTVNGGMLRVTGSSNNFTRILLTGGILDLSGIGSLNGLVEFIATGGVIIRAGNTNANNILSNPNIYKPEPGVIDDGNLGSTPSSSIFIWTGAVSQAWSTDGNWQGGSAPVNNASNVIIIPATSRSPIISTAVTCNSIQIASDATLIIQNIGIPQTSQTSFGGTVNLDFNYTIPSGMPQFNNLTIGYSGNRTITLGSSLNITGTLTISPGSTLNAGNNNISIDSLIINSSSNISSNGSINVIGNAVINGSIGSNAGNFSVGGNTTVGISQFGYYGAQTYNGDLIITAPSLTLSTSTGVTIKGNVIGNGNTLILNRIVTLNGADNLAELRINAVNSPTTFQNTGALTNIGALTFNQSSTHTLTVNGNNTFDIPVVCTGTINFQAGMTQTFNSTLTATGTTTLTSSTTTNNWHINGLTHDRFITDSNTTISYLTSQNNLDRNTTGNPANKQAIDGTPGANINVFSIPDNQKHLVLYRDTIPTELSDITEYYHVLTSTITSGQVFDLQPEKNVYLIDIRDTANSITPPTININTDGRIEIRGEYHRGPVGTRIIFNNFDFYFNEGTIRYDNNGVDIQNTFTMMSGTNRIISDNGTIEFATSNGRISGPGDLIIDSGSGIIRVNNANAIINFSGDLIINTTGGFELNNYNNFNIGGKFTKTGSGTSLISRNITASGGIEFTGNVTLGGTGTIQLTTSNNDVTFNNSITGSGNLTVTAGTGDVSFVGIGTSATEPIGALQITGADSVIFGGEVFAQSVNVVSASTITNINANITTTGTGGQIYNGPVVLGAGTVTFQGDRAPSTNPVYTPSVTNKIIFNNTITSSLSGGSQIVVHYASTEFRGDVGADNSILSILLGEAPNNTIQEGGITVIAANITTTDEVRLYINANNPSYATGASQIYRGPVVIEGEVVLTPASSLSVNFRNTLSSSSTVGPHYLTVEGRTRFSHAQQEPLEIEFNGNQTYKGLFQIGVRGLTIDATAGNTIIFEDQVQGFNTPGQTALDNDQTNRPLVINNANVEFRGQVGVTLPASPSAIQIEPSISSVTINGTGTTTINANIITSGTGASGGQTYSGHVIIGGSSATRNLTNTAATTTVRFAETITGGGNSLTVTGNARFDNTVTGVAVLTVTENAEVNSNITTTSNQIYNNLNLGSVTRILESTGGSITASGNVTGTAGVIINSAEGITIDSTATTNNLATTESGSYVSLTNTALGDITFVTNTASKLTISGENQAPSGSFTVNAGNQIEIDTAGITAETVSLTGRGITSISQVAGGIITADTLILNAEHLINLNQDNVINELEIIRSTGVQNFVNTTALEINNITIYPNDNDGDRIVRFENKGADSHITVKGNIRGDSIDNHHPARIILIASDGNVTIESTAIITALDPVVGGGLTCNAGDGPTHDETTASIFIKADNFYAPSAPSGVINITPGATGHLCLHYVTGIKNFDPDRIAGTERYHPVPIRHLVLYSGTLNPVFLNPAEYRTIDLTVNPVSGSLYTVPENARLFLDNVGFYNGTPITVNLSNNNLVEVWEEYQTNSRITFTPTTSITSTNVIFFLNEATLIYPDGTIIQEEITLADNTENYIDSSGTITKDVNTPTITGDGVLGNGNLKINCSLRFSVSAGGTMTPFNMNGKLEFNELVALNTDGGNSGPTREITIIANNGITFSNGISYADSNRAESLILDTAANNGNIIINSTITGRSGTAKNLTIKAGTGEVSLQNVGTSGAPINNLIVDTDSSVTFNGNVFASTVDVTADTDIRIAGNVTTSGVLTSPANTGQNYNGPVTIGSAATPVTLNAGNANRNIIFNRTVNSATGANNPLTINNASVRFDNIVGGIERLSSLNISSGTATISVNVPVSLTADTINTIGNQSYSALELPGSTTRTLTSSGGSVTALGVVSGTAGVIINAATGIAMNGANTLSTTASGTFVSLNNSTSGSVSFNRTAAADSSILRVAGSNTATTGTDSGNFTITNLANNSEITIADTGITATRTVDLNTTGTNSSITQEAGSIVTANTLSLNATNSITLDQNNVINIVSVTSGTIFILNNDTSLLTINDINITSPATLANIVKIDNTGDITVNGNITGNRIALISDAGIIIAAEAALTAESDLDCSSAGHIDSDASIYIEALNFTAYAPSSAIAIITPGSSGELCLENVGMINMGLNKVAGDRFHPKLKHIVIGTGIDDSIDNLDVSGGTLFAGNYDYTDAVAISSGNIFTPPNNYNIYIINASNTGITIPQILLNVTGAGYIEFQGSYITDGLSVAVATTPNGIRLNNANINTSDSIINNDVSLSGNVTVYGTNNIINSGIGTITVDNDITLNTGASLTLDGTLARPISASGTLAINAENGGVIGFTEVDSNISELTLNGGATSAAALNVRSSASLAGTSASINSTNVVIGTDSFVHVTGGLIEQAAGSNLKIESNATFELFAGGWSIGDTVETGVFTGTNGTLHLEDSSLITPSRFIANGLNLTSNTFNINHTGEDKIQIKGKATITNFSTTNAQNLIFEMIGNSNSASPAVHELSVTADNFFRLHILPGSHTQLISPLTVKREVVITSGGILNAGTHNITMIAGYTGTRDLTNFTNSGTDSVSVARWQIIGASLSANETNMNNFAFRQTSGSVTFEMDPTDTSGRPIFFEIIGNSMWQNFNCSVNGAVIQFSSYNNLNNQGHHVFLGNLNITGGAGIDQQITLTRYAANSSWVYKSDNATPGDEIIGMPPAEKPNDLKTDTQENQKFWNLNISNLNINLNYTDVYFSHAWKESIPESTLGLTNNEEVYYYALTGTGYFNYWDTTVLKDIARIMYAFAEDHLGTGGVSRIRVQTNVELTGGFSGFTIEIFDADDESVGKAGFAILPSPDQDSFYINLESKPGLYDGRPYSLRVTNNSTLLGTNNKLIDTSLNKIYTINTIPPRISYALAIPGHNQIFVQFSQGVVEGTGFAVESDLGITGTKVINTESIPDYVLEYITQTGDIQKYNLINQATAAGNKNYLIDLSLAPTVQQLANEISWIKFTGLQNTAHRALDWSEFDPDLYNPPKYPVDWTYSSYAAFKGNSHVQGLSLQDDPLNPFVLLPPFNAGENPRRITDILISQQPQSVTDANYFVWPTFARAFDANAPLSDDFSGRANVQHGVIWDFDGTGVIDPKPQYELQARVNPEVTGTPILVWGLNVPVDYRNPPVPVQRNSARNAGLWLPQGANAFIVPSFFNAFGINGTGTPVTMFDINNSVLETGGKFEFFFRLNPSSDLFVARLDAPRGVIPSNWYELVRPFQFGITEVRTQVGGVTILNNVINSDNREMTYLRYRLARPGRVTIQVYNLEGNLIKSILRNAQRDAGEHTEGWDGTNNAGRAVARGMYYIRITGPDIDEIRRVMVIR